MLVLVDVGTQHNTTQHNTTTRGLEIIENIPADRHGTPLFYCFILNCSSSIKMSGLDKNQITNTFTSTNYNLIQCNFLSSAASGDLPVSLSFLKYFTRNTNQTLSDSDRTVRCYVSEVHTDYIEHFLHVKAGRNSLLQGVIAGSWLFKL